MSSRLRTHRSAQKARGKLVVAQSSDKDDELSASDSEQEQRDTDSSDSEDQEVDAQEHANCHAAAAAGPSSQTAAAAKGRKKRAASVAFKDAVSLLPADMDEEVLRRTLRQLQPRNRMQKQSLLQSYRTHFSHWRFLLRQHFSLLFYGFGSKINLLELFAKEALTDGGVMAVYGHQPNMSAKQVLAAVASALTHRSCKTSSHSELMGLINSEPACRQLYVLIHNIDGPGLRSPEEQLWLSRLAQAPAVHLIASIDHINAALLWDNRIAAAFKWLWVEATSYASYEAETSNMIPILTSTKQSAAKRGAATVLSSLVSTARDVFRVLAEFQLEDPSSQGVGFTLLLRMVRERFICNHEHQLRSLLTEFRDHELVKLRPGADGGEVMYIPMEPDVLQKALKEMAEAAQ